MKKIVLFLMAASMISLSTSCGPKVSKRCKKDWKNVKELRKRGMMM